MDTILPRLSMMPKEAMTDEVAQQSQPRHKTSNVVGNTRHRDPGADRDAFADLFFRIAEVP